MSVPSFTFSNISVPTKGTTILLVAQEQQGTGAKAKKIPILSSTGEKLNKDGALDRAISIAKFTGASLSILDLVAPSGSKLDRIILIGVGKVDTLDETSWLRIGGKLFGALSQSEKATLIAELPKDRKFKCTADDAAAIAMGTKLRAYAFDAHKQKKKDSKKPTRLKLIIAAASGAAASSAWKQRDGVADGVMLARDLVNEPANILGPVEFAARAKALTKLGVKVEILTEPQMKKLEMGSLLSVSAGSEKPARIAIMQWKGGKAKDQPLAFVGKGVTFDTGGISLKPGAGMGDMKGDMGGAAAVTGLMHALAARKAKANVVGIIGLVENMPDGKSTRPGDVVTSMSGQTIEVLNTDAEGRLVLADCLWYCQKRFKPKFMINLATLTGAILVALGNEHAGLFSNNDDLSEKLAKAGTATDEKVWRLPLTKGYDKLIDSKNADMKNIGGRYAGSITAGQFLQRFVNKTPWAHLDVAGTAMNSPQTEFNQSWGSGYGVRLLDRLVKNDYES